MLAILGASGRSGAALCRALAGANRHHVPIVRDPTRYAALGLPVLPRVADLNNAAVLRAALTGAQKIAACVHARHAPAILAAAPPGARLVLMGSTRRHSRFPDAHGDGVRAGEAAFLASHRAGVMLHPTMIYGAEGEDNVRRLATLLARLPLAPLPNGGRALVQPIHQDDVTRCLLAALDLPWDHPETLVIPGPEPVPYRAFAEAVARAAGQRPPRILPIPAALLRALAPLTRFLPGLPHISAAEIRRLTEDKAFDPGPMRRRLGVTPIGLEEGLRRTFA